MSFKTEPRKRTLLACEFQLLTHNSWAFYTTYKICIRVHIYINVPVHICDARIIKIT